MRCISSFVLCFASASFSAHAAPWPVRFDGVGPLRIDMSLKAVNAALGSKLARPADQDSNGCFYLAVPGTTLEMMFEDGVLRRIDIPAQGFKTAAGIEVGSPVRAVQEIYVKRLTAQPHAYAPDEEHYLTVRSSSGRYAWRAETVEGKVGLMYVGRWRQVQYVERCL